jgi:hypothetical protein
MPEVGLEERLQRFFGKFKNTRSYKLGILQSPMITCRILGINPYTYLVDVLQPEGIQPAKDVLNLVPRVWKTKLADNPLKSDLSIPTLR